jgi:hypothetical protein
MPRYSHFGLYFTPEQVQSARKNQSREPLAGAWAALNNLHPAEPLAAAVADGLRWRFQDAAGETAAATLLKGTGLSGGGDYLTALMEAVALAQAAELVRDHPAFAPHAESWLHTFSERVALLNLPPAGTGFVESLWLGLVNLLTGIVLQDDTRFGMGETVFRQTIRDEVRPEGYLPRAVEGGDGGSLWRQILSAGALTLMAEAAAHVDVDLWNVESRGISAITAASYSLYYFYYPTQWRWDTMSEEQAKPLFREWGGFIEIAHRRTRLRDIQLLMDELRPFNNPYMGGLTTLSHGQAARRGLFG